MSKVRSYPKVYNIGHKAIRNIFEDPVYLEEKFDGSQANFGIIDGELKFKSKNKVWPIHGPCDMFQEGVDYLKSVEDRLEEGWVYRAEYFQKPKQNSIAYDNLPENHFVLFDVMVGPGDYLDPKQLSEIAEDLGIHPPNIYGYERLDGVAEIKPLLKRESALGGAKAEGVVIKNYFRFGRDKKPLFGKLVREDFREKNQRNHKKQGKSVIQEIIDELKTEARWKKAVQHRREKGEFQCAPQDIGPLIHEVQEDIKEEEEEYIKQKLFSEYWDDIRRAVTAGLPEWFKEKLAEGEFSDE